MQSKLNLYHMSLQVLRQNNESIEVLEGESNIPQSTDSLVGSVYQAILEATSHVASYHDWAVLQKKHTLTLDGGVTTVFNLPNDFYKIVDGSIRPITYHTWADFIISKGKPVPQIEFDFSKCGLSGAPKGEFSFRYITTGVIYAGNNLDIRENGVYEQNDDYPIIDARPIVNYASYLLCNRYYKDKSDLAESLYREFVVALQRAINAETTFKVV